MKKYLLLILLSFIANLALAQDVWLQNHFSPNSGIQLSGLENVTVLVNNNSGVIMPANTIQVNYTINGGATISQMLSSNLTPGASWNFTFSTKANLSVYGTYVIKVWVVRAGDVNHLNDTLEWTVQNDCIVMNQPQNIIVDHNATVPAVNYTSSANGVSYFWTNTNPAIGLSSSGIGNLPSFTAINKRGVPVTSTITVTPKYNISNTFSYIGNMQTFVVPAGVTRIKVDVKGSQGGSAIYNQPGTKPDDIGGKGGRVTAEYPVTAGQTLYIFVGGIGYNGGGNGGGSIAQPSGGGASDIRMGGMALANRIIVAGGGGGGGNNCSANAEPGGAGGGLIGEVGFQCGNQTGTAVGQGGTQLGGGAAGTSPATAGILGIGGNAGGLGTASGGGGGGYYGGGGAAYGGGGGGSSYTDPLATSVQHTQGFQDGLGEVMVSYYQECGPSNSKTFNITVNPTSQPNANGILFVKKGSVGTGNAWNNAIGELADALLVAKDLNAITAGSVTQIWVAKGTYKPMYSPADNNFGNQAGRDNAFLMVKDVKVYGGFDPDNGKINLATRDPQSVLTILSGDIDGNDVQSGAGATLSFSNNNENAYHVLVSAGNVGTAELNGFTITGGNGNGTAITVNGLQLWGTNGGGMNITSSSPTLSHCIFEYNQVQTGMGGALYIGTPTNEAVSAPFVSKSSFVNNKSGNIAGVGWGDEGGGALYNSASSPIITDCIFTDNLVTGSRLGGAIANNGLTMEMSNVAIKNNISLGTNGGGSGLANSGAGHTILKNVILSGNYTDGKGGAIYNNPGAISLLQNVLISGNQADAGAGIYNNGSSPVLTNVTIVGNQANLGGGIYNINSSSPLLQNTVVFGNSTGVINNLPADIPTYKNSLVQGASATGLIPFSGTATDLFVQPLTPALAVGGDYKSKSGSILVNAGDNTLFTNLDANTKDLAGNIRLKGANIDLGAYELQSQPQVISPIATITKTYGDAPFGPGGISSSGLVVGYASADNSIAEAYQDTADGNKWKLKIKKAGTVQVTASQAGGSNNGNFYDPAPNVVFNLVVNKKQITITLAGTFSKIYDGNTNATLGVANLIVDPNAIVGTDELAVSAGVTGVFDDKNVGTGKTVSVAIANVSLTGNAVANYSLANPATLTAAIGEITARAITVTAQTNTKVYDGAVTSSVIPLITSGTIAAGDQLSTAAIQKFDSMDVGTSKVLTAAGLMIADGNGGGNYQITYVAVSTGVITAKPITITAVAKTKVYGEVDPALTYNFSPALVGSDAFTGTPSRATGEDAGTYQIGQGTLTAGGNYTVSYQPASFTIEKAVLLATANNAQMCQGTGLPSFTLSYSGFRRGDGEGNISNRPIVSTNANSGSPAGSYALVPSGGSTANYSFSYANGILTINALPQLSISSNRGNNISRGETLQLTASGGTSYSWSGPGGILSGQNSAMLTIRPIASGTYIVRGTNASGCSSEQSFTVTVRDDFQAISATNLLTPNGDGINDVWKVDNIDVYPNNEVIVFDRAGRVLYRKKGYDNSWNGTVNGAALAEGTYYYVIDFGSGKLKQKGFITLIREGK